MYYYYQLSEEVQEFVAQDYLESLGEDCQNMIGDDIDLLISALQSGSQMYYIDGTKVSNYFDNLTGE